VWFSDSLVTHPRGVSHATSSAACYVVVCGRIPAHAGVGVTHERTLTPQVLLTVAPRDTRRAARTVAYTGGLRDARRRAETVLHVCVHFDARWAFRMSSVVIVPLCDRRDVFWPPSEDPFRFVPRAPRLSRHCTSRTLALILSEVGTCPRAPTTYRETGRYRRDHLPTL